MEQQIENSEKEGSNYFARNKRYILGLLCIVITLVILVIPIIPSQSSVTKTRTRNFRYSADVYGLYTVPKQVRVTNKETMGGTFSIKMKMWYNTPLGEKQLEGTSSKSSFISGGSTHSFELPEDWMIIPPMYSLTYSVVPPTTQENYQENQIDYKSIFDLIAESLKKD